MVGYRTAVLYRSVPYRTSSIPYRTVVVPYNGQNMSVPYRTALFRTISNCAVQPSTISNSTSPYRHALYRIIPYRTIPYSNLYNVFPYQNGTAARGRTAPHRTVQHRRGAENKAPATTTCVEPLKNDRAVAWRVLLPFTPRTPRPHPRGTSNKLLLPLGAEATLPHPGLVWPDPTRPDQARPDQGNETPRWRTSDISGRSLASNLSFLFMFLSTCALMPQENTKRLYTYVYTCSTDCR